MAVLGQQSRDIRGDFALPPPGEAQPRTASYAPSEATAAAASRSTSKVTLTARSIGSASVTARYEIPGAARCNANRSRAHVMSETP